MGQWLASVYSGTSEGNSLYLSNITETMNSDPEFSCSCLLPMQELCACGQLIMPNQKTAFRTCAVPLGHHVHSDCHMLYTEAAQPMCWLGTDRVASIPLRSCAPYWLKHCLRAVWSGIFVLFPSFCSFLEGGDSISSPLCCKHFTNLYLGVELVVIVHSRWSEGEVWLHHRANGFLNLAFSSWPLAFDPAFILAV